MVTVDGVVGFISGLCVGRPWVGDPQGNVAPWRDTGIEVRGPAVASIERAFAEIWSMMGPQIPEQEMIAQLPAEPAGDYRHSAGHGESNPPGRTYRGDRAKETLVDRPLLRGNRFLRSAGSRKSVILLNDPSGSRTRVTDVRGRCPNH